jgi:hypothetical protein
MSRKSSLFNYIHPSRSPALVTFETPKRRNFLRHRIVQSSDSEREEEAVQVQTGVVELSDSSDEIEFVQPKPAIKSATKTPDSENPYVPGTNRPEDEDDGSIFVLYALSFKFNGHTLSGW